MRPVEKGAAPRNYARSGDARHDLAARIGYYCSYCEMNVTNMIEVEHVVPVNRGGASLDWENFLLSCKYCNTVKNNGNAGRGGYAWPDRDNTDLLFDYDEYGIEVSRTGLTPRQTTAAQSTIDLLGLDREPGSAQQPTAGDTRWISRKESWDKARTSLSNWTTDPVLAMARQIGITSLDGHYSIWCKVFANVPDVLREIDQAYSRKGLFKQLGPNNQRIVRQNGII